MDAECYRFAKKCHAGQRRKTGEDYITHPIGVATLLMLKGYYGDYLSVALCHDVMEDDKTITEERVLFMTNKAVAVAVVLLTKTDGYVMETYLANIKANKMAYEVKLADRLHNLLTAVETDKAFKKKYIAETEKYYLDFAKGSDFYDDIKIALDRLRKTL